jgi:hypothetical protein
MPEPELFLLFVRPLNGADIRYMVIGGYSGSECNPNGDWFPADG